MTQDTLKIINDTISNMSTIIGAIIGVVAYISGFFHGKTHKK
jgi:hypothetical protein